MDALFIGENRFTPALYINNAAKIYKKLNRAYAWTNTQINGNGNAYLVYYDGSNYYKGDAIPAQTIKGANKTYGDWAYGQYVVDDMLYQQNGATTSVFIDNNVQSFSYTAGMNVYVKDSNLYCGYSNSSKYIVNRGGWQSISFSPTQSSSIKFPGIKNDSLYIIKNINNITSTSSTVSINLLDNTGVWTYIISNSDLANYVSTTNASKAVGIKDGKLYAIAENDIAEISDMVGWTDIGSWIGTLSTTYFLAISDGKLYKISGRVPPFTVTLLDDTEIWKQVEDNVCLTQSGKLYKYANSVLTQIGTKTNWIKIAGFGAQVGLDSNGKVYLNIGVQGESKILNDDIVYSDIAFVRNVTEISSTPYIKPIAIVYTGNTTIDKHTVYTIGKPDVGFTTYADTDMTTKSTISAVNENNNTITDEYYSYTRDSSLDGVFSGISTDATKQLLTLADILNAMR